jgi:hypothetical protein
MTTLPLYGRQYIRFAETFQVAPGNEVNSYRVVVLDDPFGDGMPLNVVQGNGSAVGISQYSVADNVPPTGFATDGVRTLTVATSGVLLVEADDDVDSAAIGTALLADANGVATTDVLVGEAVTINGLTPTIRDVVTTGGVTFVLVSM